MKKENTDFAAGRLGEASHEGGESRKGASKDGNYGAGRLGLSSDSSEAPEEQLHEVSSQEHPSPGTSPEQSATGQASISPSETGLPADTGEPTSPEKTSRQRELLELLRSLTYGHALLAAASGVGVLLLLGVLLWTGLRGEGGSPQVASGETHPSVVNTPGVFPGPADDASATGGPIGDDSGNKDPNQLPGKSPQGSAMHTDAKADEGEPGPLIQTLAGAIRLATSVFAKRNGDSPSPPPTGIRPGASGQPASSRTPPAQVPEPAYIPCPAGFKLTGIMHWPKGKFANINGRYVTAGDTVGNATVVEIKNFCVEMELEGRRFLLAVGAKPGKQPPPKKPEKTDEAQEEQY